jgi:hypothetical protein
MEEHHTHTIRSAQKKLFVNFFLHSVKTLSVKDSKRLQPA